MIQILIILTPILLIAAVTDIRWRKIPNWLTFPAIILGITYHLFNGGIQGCLLSMAGVFLGIAFFLPFYLMGGTGAGDVKLMGAVGGFLGPAGVFYAFLSSSIAGGIYATLLLIRYGLFTETFRRYGGMVRNLLAYRQLFYIPPNDPAAMPVLKFGIAIAVGTIGYMLADLKWAIHP